VIYTIVKSLHISTVVISGLLFFWRGARAIFSYNNNGFALKVLPHIIDTILLGSAIYLAYRLQVYPFTHHWLTAKLFGLIAYIILGHYTLKKAKNFFSRVFFFVLSLACFIYVIGAAHFHSPASWFVRYPLF
jgi:uncharacterized membrane protein SirB2